MPRLTPWRPGPKNSLGLPIDNSLGMVHLMSMRQNKRQDTDDRAGAEAGCSRNVHLQVTPELYAALDAAWKRTALRSRNDWIRTAIGAALEREAK